jgi:glycerophosphoryl diester phosphodiesterase
LTNVMSDSKSGQDVAVLFTRGVKHIDSKKYQMRVEGHRGAGYLEPENSIKAFKRAIEIGLDGVELDVWLTKDNVAVVVHGYDGGVIHFVDDVKEVIHTIESKDLEKYTLKNGEKIPTLSEVLDVCKDKVCINIELKETNSDVISVVLDLLIEKNMLEQITFSSFIHTHRERLTKEVEKKNIRTRVPFGFLMRLKEKKLPDFEVECQPGDSLNVEIKYLESLREECLETMAKARARQMTIGFWFPMEYVHEHTFFDDLADLKIDTLITNVPLVITEYFEQKQLGV